MRLNVLIMMLLGYSMAFSDSAYARLPADTQSISQPIVRIQNPDSAIAINVLIPKKPFKSFRGALLGDAILLQWRLQTVHNETIVYLERNIDNKGFQTLIVLRQVAANAAYTDVRPAPGTRYRLRTVGQDGIVIYSQEVSLPNDLPLAGR